MVSRGLRVSNFLAKKSQIEGLDFLSISFLSDWPPVSPLEYAIVASPLVVGTDIRNMTPIMKAGLLNEELIAINQDHTAPAGDLVSTNY